MSQLELVRGHFYNWYDTRDLRPLDPKYVSSVDSGNMAGHLLALGNGCRDLMRKSSLDPQMLGGIEDSIRLLQEALHRVADTRRVHTVTRKQLSNAADELAAAVRAILGDAADWGAAIVEISARAHTAADIAQTLAQELGDTANSELRVWANAAKTSSDGYLRDAKMLFPWLRLDSQSITATTKSFSKNAPEWIAIEPFFGKETGLTDAPERFEAAVRELTALRERSAKDSGQITRIDALIGAMQQSSTEAASLHRRLLAIAEQCEETFEAMDFSFLFDKTRKLLSIGYRATDGTIDPSCYDLLASEARLASFIAIAKGDVPSSHWFRLGRALTPVGRGSALISWSGSMFEYLMPALMMISPTGSLLNQTYELIVRRQIDYGKERGVPWGISESAYNARNLDLTYQYTAFGVPGLGLKRGLSEDLVI